MDLYQVISYPLYAGGVLEIILGIALLKQVPRKSRAMRACAGLFFSAAVWVLFTAISYTLEAQGKSFNFLNRASWIGWFMIPACLQFAYYMQDENSRAARITGYVLYPFWTAVLVLTLVTDLVEPGDPSLVPYAALNGPLENPLRIIGTLLAVWLLVTLYRTKNRMTGIRKTQFSLFFFGTLFFNIGCIMIAGILPLFGAINPALTTFFSLPWVVITYYAITRRRFFDLRLFISRVLSIGLLLVLLSVIQLVLFRALVPVLGDSLSISSSLCIIGILFFATRINKKIELHVQRLILKGRSDYQDILRETTRAVSTILDLGELLGYLIASMKKSLEVENIYLLLKEQDGHYAIKRGYDVEQERLERSFLIDTLFKRLQQDRHGLVREELEHKTADGAAQVVDAMLMLGADIVIPLLFKGELKGFMVLGPKGGRESYVGSDIDLLEALAGHAIIAIENARLYEEARRARESMRESEAKFRTLAETAATAIFMHQGGNFTYANRAAQDIGGYTADEYLTMNFLSLAHPEYVDMIKARARDRLSGGEAPSQYEFKIIKKSGEERWVLMTAGISQFEGKATVIGTLIDITERKQAEEARERLFQELKRTTSSLRESEAKFRSLSETAPAAVFIHRGGNFLYANPASEIMFGYTRGEFFAMDFWGVTHPEDKEMIVQRARTRLSGDQAPQRYEFRTVKKNREVIWVDMAVGVIEYEGKPAVIGMCFDITARKQAEQERERFSLELQQALQSLKESEARFRTLAETTAAMIVIHRGGRLLYTNPAVHRITGFTAEELAAKEFFELIHPEFRDMMRERGKARLAGIEQPTDYEFKIVVKNGDTRWANITAAIIDFEGNPAVIATLFDVTDRKQAEADKLKFYEERIVEEKRHVMEKEKLLMDLHDGIGGITTNISILSELALKATDIEGARGTLATISRLSREGSSEIRGFMHSLDAAGLNWRTLATELRSQGTNLVEPHHIRFAMEAALENIQDQPGSLLWVNLFKIYKETLINIIKHANADSVVVEFRVSREGLLLDVFDNGTGWDAGRGAGRGLSNMKKRAEELGGRLSLSSGKGTRVVLEIPLPVKYPISGMAISPVV